ncbi:hypothetical protein GCM10009721_26450 [Terrabacter tumescens]|uniref:Glycosyltransferase n=2 Tax=Terrabacter tumescens TaxID=60443 RepID=A0ABQ2I284_9MICO|nr:hypothetical protein GCM10009721_26450 [Terrabacter tumescens]
MTLQAFSSYSLAAASTRVRLYDWFDHLGVPVIAHTYIGTHNSRASTLLRHIPEVVSAEVALRKVDYSSSKVIVSREVSPLSSGSLEKKVLKGAAHSVFDFDDALYADLATGRRLLRQRSKCQLSVEAADVVIAGNEHLAEWASAFSKRVLLIPSCVEPSHYQYKQNWELHDVPVIVWLGSPATEQYLAPLSDALNIVHARTRARLRVISGPDDNPRLSALSHMIDRVPWSPTVVKDALVTGDLAIGPLSDTTYARGKCAYKLLQYAATGLPMVGSPVGANRRALERFEGLAATTQAEWVDGLTMLLTETASSRQARADAGLAALVRHYSFEAWSSEWRSAVLAE